MSNLSQDQKKKLKQDYKRKLKQGQKEILSEITKKYHLPDVTMNNNTSDELKESLLQALTDEFCATGLREDSEPNPRGLLIESVIDTVLGHSRSRSLPPPGAPTAETPGENVRH